MTEPGSVGNWSPYYHQSSSVLDGMAGHLHPPKSVIRYTQLWEGQGGSLHLGGADSWRPSALAPGSWAPGLHVKRDLSTSVAASLPQ